MGDKAASQRGRILMSYITYKIKNRIEQMPSADRIIIAIDGRCASGKSTLASDLENELGCAVFHMDDFFLRPEQRTPQRYAEPGGNVDRERFWEEILEPLRRGEKQIKYRPFDCRSFELMSPRRIDVGRIAIVEGSYSCHPELWDCYDLHIFLTLSAQQQLERILSREGAERAEVFRDKWIPLEESYFSAFKTEERCDLRFNTGGRSES